MLRALIFSGVFTDLLVDDCASVHEKQSNKTSWPMYSAILNSDMSVLKGTVWKSYHAIFQTDVG